MGEEVLVFLVLFGFFCLNILLEGEYGDSIGGFIKFLFYFELFV